MRLMTSLLLDPENADEYRRRHDELWPEVSQEMRARGASNISIFYDRQSGRAYMYLEVADIAQWTGGGVSEVTSQWWRYMSDIMPTNPDSSPVTFQLTEVFHQD